MVKSEYNNNNNINGISHISEKCDEHSKDDNLSTDINI